MNNFELGKHHENDPLEVDEETEKLLVQSQANQHIKNMKATEYFERVLVAGEMTELGLDSKQNFSEEDLENIQKDLTGFRQEFMQEKNSYIGLAKYLYRLDQVGIQYPPLSNEEVEKLQSIPKYLRQHPENGNLVYLPQLAHVLGVPLTEIADKNDGQLVKEYLQQELAIGGKEEIKAIMVTGMLQDLDPTALEELIKSVFWKEKNWGQALELVEQYKQEKQGYILARSLPALKKLQSVIERIKS